MLKLEEKIGYVHMLPENGDVHMLPENGDVHMLPENGDVHMYICYQFRSKGNATSITSTSGDRFFYQKLVAISIFSFGLSIEL